MFYVLYVCYMSCMLHMSMCCIYVLSLVYVVHIYDVYIYYVWAYMWYMYVLYTLCLIYVIYVCDICYMLNVVYVQLMLYTCAWCLCVCSVGWILQGYEAQGNPHIKQKLHQGICRKLAIILDHFVSFEHINAVLFS